MLWLVAIVIAMLLHKMIPNKYDKPNRKKKKKKKKTFFIIKPGPEVIKFFIMRTSAELEICLVNKSQIINNCKFFHNFSANKYENAN